MILNTVKIKEISHLGFIELLGQLTSVGNVTKEQFVGQLEKMQTKGDYQTIVLFDPATKRIMAAGSLVLEHKFIHDCGILGHIEDIVVHHELRGKGIGKEVIGQLVERAKIANCYKITLDCDDKNVQFYEKTGFTRKGNQMTLYF